MTNDVHRLEYRSFRRIAVRQLRSPEPLGEVLSRAATGEFGNLLDKSKRERTTVIENFESKCSHCEANNHDGEPPEGATPKTMERLIEAAHPPHVSMMQETSVICTLPQIASAEAIGSQAHLLFEKPSIVFSSMIHLEFENPKAPICGTSLGKLLDCSRLSANLLILCCMQFNRDSRLAMPEFTTEHTTWQRFCVSRSASLSRTPELINNLNALALMLFFVLFWELRSHKGSHAISRYNGPVVATQDHLSSKVAEPVEHVDNEKAAIANPVHTKLFTFNLCSSRRGTVAASRRILNEVVSLIVLQTSIHSSLEIGYLRHLSAGTDENCAIGVILFRECTSATHAWSYFGNEERLPRAVRENRRSLSRINRLFNAFPCSHGRPSKPNWQIWNIRSYFSRPTSLPSTSGHVTSIGGEPAVQCNFES